MDKNKELELYKLVTKGEYECGWITDDEFCVWLYLFELDDFVKSISDIFGDYVFDEGGYEIILMKDCVCINLTGMLDEVEFEGVFPKDEFKH